MHKLIDGQKPFNKWQTFEPSLGALLQAASTNGGLILWIIMRSKSKKIFGVGINDATYAVLPKVDGKIEACHFYRTWQSMLKRCYCKKYHDIRPTYKGCSVCDDWLVFSRFKAWMQQQDWKGKQLDKDIINPGNKVYSPENCAFVDRMTNTFIISQDSSRGNYPVGVCLDKKCGLFVATCNNPFVKKKEAIGWFSDPNKAHIAWKKRKHDLAMILSLRQSDHRVAASLMSMYK